MILLIPIRNGEPQFNAHAHKVLKAAWKKYDGKNVRLIIKNEESVRSTRQNSYLWGVVYAFISAETGHTPEEIHEALKLRFLPREFIMLGDEEFAIRKSTALLSTNEFSKYTEAVCTFAGTELGISIPPPTYAD